MIKRNLPSQFIDFLFLSWIHKNLITKNTMEKVQSLSHFLNLSHFPYLTIDIYKHPWNLKFNSNLPDICMPRSTFHPISKDGKSSFSNVILCWKKHFWSLCSFSKENIYKKKKYIFDISNTCIIQKTNSETLMGSILRDQIISQFYIS